MNAPLHYLALGCSVIPLRPGDKRPALAWAEFTRRRATEAEIGEWWRRRPDLNCSIVCGRVSGLVVIDCDPRNGGDASLAAYPALRGPAVQTGSGGGHFYCAEPGFAKVPSLLPGVDVQGEGAYVVAPPSVHPNGARYQWLPGRALGEVPLPAAPFWLRDLVQRHRVPPPAAGGRGDAPPLALADVLAVLAGVRRAGAGWLAKCPAHHDVEPSLSIGAGTRQAVVLHCHAGCHFREIRAALAQRGATYP